MNPLISIIIPTFNRAHLISETLDSVQNQTYENWECIIVDDGSDDDTEDIVQKYIDSDSRFSYHTRPSNRAAGGNAARNFGFQISKGKYINWLDSDDLISVDKLELQIESLSEVKSEFHVATCRWGLFTDPLKNIDLIKNLKVYQSYDNSREFLQDLYGQLGYFPPHTYLISRKLVERTGYWNENLMINQDGEFFNRIICNAQEIIFEPNSYVLYRETRKDSTSLMSKEKAHDYYNSWKLIEANLNINLGVNSISNFDKIKSKAYNRIPAEIKDEIDNEKSFFYNQIIQRRKKNSFVRKLTRFIKAKLQK